MTTETDKLQQLALDNGFCLMTSDECEPTPEQLAAFRAAILADVTADVEPVWDVGTSKLYSASTVAALKAERDAAIALLKEANWVIDSFASTCGKSDHCAKVQADIAALTKGQP